VLEDLPLRSRVGTWPSPGSPCQTIFPPPPPARLSSSLPEESFIACHPLDMAVPQERSHSLFPSSVLAARFFVCSRAFFFLTSPVPCPPPLLSDDGSCAPGWPSPCPSDPPLFFFPRLHFPPCTDQTHEFARTAIPLVFIPSFVDAANGVFARSLFWPKSLVKLFTYPWPAPPQRPRK